MAGFDMNRGPAPTGTKERLPALEKRGRVGAQTWGP